MACSAVEAALPVAAAGALDKAMPRRSQAAPEFWMSAVRHDTFPTRMRAIHAFHAHSELHHEPQLRRAVLRPGRRAGLSSDFASASLCACAVDPAGTRVCVVAPGAVLLPCEANAHSCALQRHAMRSISLLLDSARDTSLHVCIPPWLGASTCYKCRGKN